MFKTKQWDVNDIQVKKNRTGIQTIDKELNVTF